MASSEKAASILRDVPAFPPVALKVLQLLSSRDYELKQLAGLIGTDPALASEVLRTASSPLFATVHKIADVQHAVSLVGGEWLRAMVVTAAMKDYIHSSLRGGYLFRRAWRHSVACALLSRGLASVWGGRAEVAYTAGLLHDLGRLALLSTIHSRDFAGLEGTVPKGTVELLRMEEDLFGIDHCAAGSYLMKSWGFPDELRAPASSHHASLSPGQIDLAGTVCRACRLATTLGFAAVKYRESWTLEELWEDLPGQVRSNLDVNFSVITEALEEKINSLAKV